MNYLYYNISCSITIGSVKFDSVNSIVIDSSIKKLTDTASIVIPRAFNRLKKDGKQTSLQNQNIKDFIKVGDKVSISIGYDDDLEEEFEGYVSSIGADVPLVIKCEDEMFVLKKTTFLKVFKSVTLKELLRYIAPGYEYDVIDNINLGAYTIDNKSAYEVLEDLRKENGLHSRFPKGKLVVGFPISMVPGVVHEINMNRNVRAKSNDLKFVRKEDLKLMLKGISINQDGERIVSEYGDKGGILRTLHFTDKTITEVDELLEKNYKSLNFDGYQGNLPTWCLPRTKAGDAVQITDPNYKNSERDGKYLVESVKIKLNDTDGILRINKLGMSL